VFKPITDVKNETQSHLVQVPGLPANPQAALETLLEHLLESTGRAVRRGLLRKFSASL